MDKINIARHRYEKEKPLLWIMKITNMFFKTKEILECVIMVLNERVKLMQIECKHLMMRIFSNFKITHTKYLQPLYLRVRDKNL